jgi:hypothetical protein
MALWGKKRSDDDDDDMDGPMTSDSGMPKKIPPPPPPPTESSDLPHKVIPPPRPAEAMRMTEPPKPTPQAQTIGPLVFGIDEAVLLVRQLPTRNTELVMQVVKKTLEAVRVDVAQIIDGATKKENVIEDRITTLRKEIEKLEGQIASAKKEISQLEAEQREVTSVKERLIQAQKAEADVTSDRPVGKEHERANPTAKPAANAPPAIRPSDSNITKAEPPPPSPPPPAATPKS